MSGFRDIAGHEKTIEHLKNSIRSGKISHAYLLTGDEGMGKETVARAYAQTLQCTALQEALEQQDGGELPLSHVDACGECRSCIQAQKNSQPDIITWRHAKEKTFSVDDVRGLVADVQIRPYASRFKVYIVPDAQLMTAQAQNALLKTLEEPPEYAVILLLATSAEAMLDTILSRCIVLPLHPVPGGILKQYLCERHGIEDYEAEICEAFAQGNVGRAVGLATSGHFQGILETTVRILVSIRSWELPEITAQIRQMTADLVNVDDILDLFTVWYRDVLLFKATGDADGIVFRQQIVEIREAAQKSSYDGIQTILEAIGKAKVRLAANVSFDLVMELLLLTMKEN